MCKNLYVVNYRLPRTEKSKESAYELCSCLISDCMDTSKNCCGGSRTSRC